jgi:hypothetical protein
MFKGTKESRHLNDLCFNLTIEDSETNRNNFIKKCNEILAIDYILDEKYALVILLKKYENFDLKERARIIYLEIDYLFDM